jgi:hypothetical protein
MLLLLVNVAVGVSACLSCGSWMQCARLVRRACEPALVIAAPPLIAQGTEQQRVPAPCRFGVITMGSSWSTTRVS